MARNRTSVTETQTPEEIAAQKAERSAQYRGSQTAKNLIFALAITIGVVILMVLIVPRGTPVVPDSVDVASRVAETEEFLQSPVLNPEIPAGWRVNKAELDRSGQTGPVFTITFVPGDRGFVLVNQAFDTDSFTPDALVGISSSGTVTIDGREWTEFKPRDPNLHKNVSYALGTPIGDDYIMLSGSTSPQRAKELAESLDTALTTLEQAGEGS